MATASILPDGREKVWILEMNSNPLKIEKQNTTRGKLYKYRGLCAEFTDDINENNRLYDKSNYDEKAGALYEKIEKRALLGELDHNEDFLVSMKNASHVVTGLKDLGKTYEIEIELIPGTVQGNNAIALAEAKVPLFISSRASGYIDRSGNVTLEKIYTYDLVSEPGFKNAELVSVNESLRPDGKIRQFKNRNVRIYKWNEPGDKDHFGKKSSEINKSNIDNMAYATKAELATIQKQLSSLLKKNGIRAINESLHIPAKLRYNGIPVEMLSKVPQANDVLTVDSVDFKVKNVANIDESADNSPNFKLRGTYAYTLDLVGANGATKTGYITKTGEFHIADEGVSTAVVKESASLDATIRKVFSAFEAKVNELIDGVNAQKVEQSIATKYIDGLSKLVEHTINEHDRAVKYINLMADEHDRAVKFVNVMADEHDRTVKFVNVMADHSDTSTKVINKLIESSDAQVKRIQLITESLNATQQFVNEHAAYSDVQTKILNTLTSHSDKATKHLNMLHKHSDQLTSLVNVHEAKFARGIKMVPATAKVIESKKNNTSAKPAIILKKGDNIREVTQKILAKVSSNKTEETRLVLEAKYPFTKQFTEAELKEFRALPDNKKDYVLAKLGTSARKANIMEAIHYAGRQSNGLEFIDAIPKEKLVEWKRLPIERKQRIIALFQSKNLRSATAIEDFWDSIDLKPVKTTGLVRRIDESIEKPMLERSAMGYSVGDIDSALGL